MEERVIFKDGHIGIFYNDFSVSEDIIEFNDEKQCYILHNGSNFAWSDDYDCWIEI